MKTIKVKNMKKAERRKLKEKGLKPQRLNKAIRKIKASYFKYRIDPNIEKTEN